MIFSVRILTGTIHIQIWSRGSPPPTNDAKVSEYQLNLLTNWGFKSSPRAGTRLDSEEL